MADLSKPKLWTVGLSGDRYATEIYAGGKAFLAIPFALTNPSHYLHPSNKIFAKTKTVKGALKGTRDALEITAMRRDNYDGFADLDRVSLIARDCRKPTASDIERLCIDIYYICRQLDDIPPQQMMIDHFERSESDLPVLRPNASSTMRARTVYLLAARR